MTTLNVVVTHLPPPAVLEGLGYLQDVAPEARFAVCYGGPPGSFAEIQHAEKVFVDDPSLRAPPRTFQSYHEILGAVYDRFVRPDGAVQAIYVFEYDHLILDGSFEERLSALAAATHADFMGKTCVERTGTNWLHYWRFRRDERLLAHLRSLSVREDPARMYGTLGTGFWLTRAALEAYVSVEEHPPCYGELYVPTLLHHLGFKLIDIDTHTDLYRNVGPDHEFTLAEVLRLKREGETFVHPYKGVGAIEALRTAEGGPSYAIPVGAAVMRPYS